MDRIRTKGALELTHWDNGERIGAGAGTGLSAVGVDPASVVKEGEVGVLMAYGKLYFPGKGYVQGFSRDEALEMVEILK